ncbi:MULTISPECIES: diphosphate--fructose-6-phosphate 1-phosphotransferase [Aminobacter]|jgi:6-phosphofructokinase 1|uniref:Pyrophosphate--fructose 6-phosphate 1-phosphotransferase n=2 Tax=Aminobacter TaxID=31988 RepID=A0AAC9FDC4_AMIAI|nr:MULTISPECIES: diphosphate--fructose-6-phosphate 1-phosphotransferase [Aminobacter]AMS40798.1 6-phosphofructokinase [Aminobacter aminovorans]MBA8908629.1 6-phosphofructokinase 1 [Aminobacter ciceronei]MBA9022435.1 6-phosphofructokinase 1 [Aminobacter ciceronei]MBB3709013.1 6-phosphofructokinase 1 [Aminobacter aminovorans]MRX35585.1 diphosphate--fructose-6-phosphate 1-phosphotransferase [Aminobacter sp. MDW-2]
MPSTFVIAQGGGPTAVINQTMAGAVLEIRRRHPKARVLGSRHGVRGIRDGDYVDLTDIPEEQLLRIAATPGAALGSTRDKPDAAYCDLVLEGLKKADARAFIYIGGNDTAGTQQILTDAAQGSIAFVHAPKTIDNDLKENDHTPGFISAAEFVAGAFLSVDLDFRALPGIYVGIVMGRHAGFLTAAAAAWRDEDTDGPHLIYVPERAFSVPRFIDEVKETLARHRRCVVAVSEGVSTADGKALVESIVPADKLERDAHGNIKLSGSDLSRAFENALAEGLPGKRARVDALGYMPRGYIGAVNAVDAQEAFDAGVFAVDAADKGGGSVALKYEGGKTVLKLVPLANVAGKTRHMPDDYMLPDVNHLSEKGMDYLRRLVPGRFKIGRPFV